MGDELDFKIIQTYRQSHDERQIRRQMKCHVRKNTDAMLDKMTYAEK